ncbi:WD40-repeat-containing domain protein [Dichomitus squalens]|uniref:WD40-repeat-containing domain protein n=1 Tax=Dichomitus squalens TaxID=114155 RepID=A0A4Q9M662_9APHY|nr:WD40-repeat-containing domain protein [Dichomitus squalens]
MTHIKPLFSPDSRCLLVPSGSSCGYCGVWDLVSSAYLALEMPPGGEDVYPVSAVFSRLGTHIAIGYRNGSIRIWDTTGRTRQEFLLLKAHEGWMSLRCGILPGRLLSTSDDRTVKVWNVRTGVMVHLLEEHRADVHPACFSHVGSSWPLQLPTGR